MTQGNREQLAAFFLAAMVGSALILLAFHRTKKDAPEQPTATIEEALPSISEIQRRLNALDPEQPLRVDGKLGPATQAKWDRVFVRESAKQAWADFEKASQQPKNTMKLRANGL